MAAQPVLPDFEAISRSHADLSRELGRCGNLPTLQEGNLILQTLREMQEQMQEMRGEMQEMREEIRQTRNLVAMSGENSIARLHNSQIISSDQPLMPLHSVLSNEPIPLFPNTINDLQHLSSATTLDILRALGCSTSGNASTRKSRLRLQCGLKEEPV
ncbi:MAG: hypothetical protein M1836_003009 [Candelina mexicana]|nr:MAG: hypothetical protein M1836_003009 [Candelina mexicana]